MALEDVLGGALGGLVGGVIRRGELRDQAELAAALFEETGHETGQQIAEALRTDPRAGMEFLQRFGGLGPAYEAVLQQAAARAKAEQAQQAGLLLGGVAGEQISPAQALAAGIKPSDVSSAARLRPERPGVQGGYNVVDPQGNRGPLIEGGLYLPPGATEPVPIPGGSQVFRAGEEGPPGSVGTGLTPSQQGEELQALLAQERNTAMGIRLTRDIREQLRPEALGAPGAIAAGVESLRAQLEGAARLAGADVAANDATFRRAIEGSQDLLERAVGSASSSLGATAAQRAVIRSLVQDLAYAFASSRESGKLSESDVRSALETIGQSSSPRVFATVLEDLETRLRRRFEDRLTQARRRNPEAVADVGGLVPPPISRARVTPAQIGSMSLDQLRAIEGELDAEQQQAVRARARELRDAHRR